MDYVSEVVSTWLKDWPIISGVIIALLSFCAWLISLTYNMARTMWEDHKADVKGHYLRLDAMAEQVERLYKSIKSNNYLVSLMLKEHVRNHPESLLKDDV